MDRMRVLETGIGQINLDWFYGTSDILGYLMPNPFLYI